MRKGTSRACVIATIFVTTYAVAGCSASDETEEATSTSADPVTAWQQNTVTASMLRLRAWNASDADVIGQMSGCSTFYVDHVDWNTGMAYGYSYQLGRSGWALAHYLSTNGCVIGGGSG